MNNGKINILIILSIFITSCDKSNHIVGNELPPWFEFYEYNTYRMLNFLPVVKFCEDTLREHILVCNRNNDTSKDAKLYVNYPPTSRMVDSLSSSHIYNPYVALPNDYYVIHWRWMGLINKIQDVDICNSIYSTLDDYYWNDVSKFPVFTGNKEKHKLAPFTEIYYYPHNYLDKTCSGTNHENLPPHYGFDFYNIGMTKDDIYQLIYHNDSVFNEYLIILDSLFRNDLYKEYSLPSDLYEEYSNKY